MILIFKFFLGESIERCVAYKDYTRIFAYYNKFAIPTVVKEVIGQLDEDKKTAIENNTAIKLNK